MVNAQPQEIEVEYSTTLNINVLTNALRPLLNLMTKSLSQTLTMKRIIGAWGRLEDTGMTIGEWQVDRESGGVDA